MGNLEEIERLYGNGQSTEALEKINQLTGDVPLRALELKGWALYRLGRHEEAKATALAAEKLGSVNASELLAQQAAHLKDFDFLEEISRRIPGNPGIINARMIAAGDVNSPTSLEDVVEIGNDAINNHGELVYTNIANNAGWALYLRARDEKDLLTAIRLWEVCLPRYGTILHHQAALHYRLSLAYEQLREIEAALTEAFESFRIWKTQVTLEPENKEFQKKLSGSRERLIKLINVG